MRQHRQSRREHRGCLSQPVLSRQLTLDPQAESDPVAPRRLSIALKSMLGDRVTIVVIPNASHALMPEQPAVVSDAIATFAHRIYKS
jgi:pimeloyl-ACP methyl ester carboxylesterase